MSVRQEDYSTWDIVKCTQYGIISRCKELLEAGYDVRTPDADNITLLHWAAINNRLDIARYYISLGAVVDVLGGDLLATPLHWAIREGHIQMVVLLLQFGADPGVRDAEGCAAIHVAVQCGQTAVVAYLIAKGTDVDLYDAHGKTPLMWATWRTYGVDPTRTLLSLYASVNMKDLVQHNTPLHLACLSQNTNVVMLLIQAGADLDAKNDLEETPLDIAKQKKNVWISSRIQMIRKEKGLDAAKGLVKQTMASKTFRQRLTVAVTFFVMFSIGFIFELSTPSWLLKAGLFVVCYAIVYAVSVFFITSNEVSMILPLGISFATKFWVFVTSFLYYWSYIYSPIAKLLFFVVTPGMWYCFWKAFRSDPGIIAAPEDQKKRAIVHLAETEGLKMETVCSTCLIVKPIRSKHCSVTNKCIAKFDHYCPWVFNAVGSENHAYFIGYLFFLSGLLAWNLYGAFKFWAHIDSYPSGTTALEKWWLIVKYSPWVVWIFINCLFHFIWVCVLLSCQMYQIAWLGVTTNERMNAGRYHHFHSSQNGNLEQSPFNRGVLNNLADFFQCSCFGFLKPLSIDWKTKTKFEPEFQNITVHKIHENV
ncbi:palmitoyltransferase ZDHHC17-like [Clavelina lepadiformis]|uniref:Palmitoyltransferase n=1 Tax=Clavelina lepadiformis TaxID=159417 RepID=A0ABP0FBA5_CLALP